MFSIASVVCAIALVMISAAFCFRKWLGVILIVAFCAFGVVLVVAAYNKRNNNPVVYSGPAFAPLHWHSFEEPQQPQIEEQTLGDKQIYTIYTDSTAVATITPLFNLNIRDETLYPFSKESHVQVYWELKWDGSKLSSVKREPTADVACVPMFGYLQWESEMAEVKPNRMELRIDLRYSPSEFRADVYPKTVIVDLEVRRKTAKPEESKGEAAR